MSPAELNHSDKRRALSRAASHLARAAMQIEDLRERCSGLDRNPKIEGAEVSIRAKLRRAERRLAESRIAHLDTWPDDKRELSGLLAELIIDVGCLRVRTGALEVGRVC